MNKDCDKIWTNCLNVIRQEISSQSFQTWFSPIVPKKIQDNVLTVQIPSQIFYEWIEGNYLDVLKKAIGLSINSKCKLEYVIEKRQQTAGGKHLLRQTNQVQDFQKTPLKQLTNGKRPTITFRELPFINRYNFENFVEGRCNRVVKSAATAIAQNPGKTSFNPLMIYGGVGLGKTHIAQAIGNHIMSVFDRNQKIKYVPAELFASQYIHAVRENEIHAFSDKFMDVDLLIVDDIQFLAGKEKTQEIFFHIFNYLHQNGKQLVMTSDTAPHNISGLQERLLSRFKWGLTTQLENPDLDTRISIIEKKASSANLFMDHDVMRYIASFGDLNIREVEGVLISIVAHTTINNVDVTLTLVKQIIGEIAQEVGSEDVSLEKVLDVVANHFRLDSKEIKGSLRTKEVVLARKMIMHIAKTHTNKTLKAIGLFFGKKHHSSIVYAVKNLEDLLNADLKIKKSYFNVLDKLGIFGAKQFIEHL